VAVPLVLPCATWTTTSSCGPILGGVVSRAMTAKLAVPLFPWPSTAEQMTLVVPSGNVAPEEWSQRAATGPSTRSLAVGWANVTLAPSGPVASTVTSVGTVTTGGLESRTVTAKLPLVELPLRSEATQLTRVVPRGNTLPEVGRQLTGTSPSTSSIAVTE
jgi:hypothetical protein